MKKNPKPLVFYIHSDLLDTDEVKELLRKGHLVTSTVEEADLVIGPNCYRISRETVGLLELAVKSARALKYPKKEKENEGSLAET